MIHARFWQNDASFHIEIVFKPEGYDCFDYGVRCKPHPLLSVAARFLGGCYYNFPCSYVFPEKERAEFLLWLTAPYFKNLEYYDIENIPF